MVPLRTAPGPTVICDRENAPWVLVRDKDSPHYPYKAEILHYMFYPGHIEYTLVGTTLHCWVQRVCIANEGDRCPSMSQGANSVLPLREDLSEGADVYFRLRGDEHIAFGQVGTSTEPKLDI